MKNLFKFVSVFSFLILFPIITFAATGICDGLNGLGKLICQIKEILNSVIPILVAIGVIFFIWGVIRYVIADSEEVKTKGKSQMIYGIIGLAVIVGLGGLVNMVVDTFDLGGSKVPVLDTGATGVCTAPVSGSALGAYLNYITCVINGSVIPLIFTLATVMFIWGAVKFFIINADEEAKRAQGKQYMIWGIIALAVMVSIWGLVGILGTTFGFGSQVHVIPQVHP